MHGQIKTKIASGDRHYDEFNINKIMREEIVVMSNSANIALFHVLRNIPDYIASNYEYDAKPQCTSTTILCEFKFFIVS